MRSAKSSPPEQARLPWHAPGLVAGVDEAGRGPLAGPVVAAAVILDDLHPIAGLADSKKLTAARREALFDEIRARALCFSIAEASVEEIDRLNILQATLLAILLVQTVVMFAYAYFVTFRVMGSDYDAAVIAAGHCGFGMGATPNAMANMQAFTAANGPSLKAFFVIPLVGSLFIDFFNAVIITGYMNYLK